MASNYEIDDTLTVSKVYEILKSPAFLKDLYWDILSGIKDKKTYKFMKGATEKVIKENVDTMKDLGESDEDDMKRKTIVAQISSMTYAVDTVFSKILYMKLEKAWKSQISVLLSELKEEGKIPDELWSQLTNAEPQVSIENPGPSHAFQPPVRENLAEERPVVEKTPPKATGRRRGRKPTKKKAAEVCKEVEHFEVDHMDVKCEDSDQETADLPVQKSRQKIQENPRKELSEPSTSSPLKNLTTKIASLFSSSPRNSSKEKPKDLLEIFNSEDDSDAEDDAWSLGHMSSVTVSSVHTSDLSSYDDEISLSSEDECGEKKKISIREVEEQLGKDFGKLASKIKSIQIGPEKFNGLQGKSSDREVQRKLSDHKVQTKSSDHEEFPEENTVRKPEIKKHKKKRVIKKKTAATKNFNNEILKEENAFVKEKENFLNSLKQQSLEQAKQNSEENVTEIFVENLKEENRVSTADMANCTADASSILSPDGLGRRSRKPNSKYNSDDMYCFDIKVKDRKKSLSSVAKANETMSSNEPSPIRKKLKTNSDLIREVNMISANHGEKYVDSDVKSPTKPNRSSDIQKSPRPVRSLTSRKTAPLTLFST